MDKPSDADSLLSTDPMWKLVDDFLGRAQRGEQPTIDEYCEKHPQLAKEIRDLFPALVVIEDLQPASCELPELSGQKASPEGAVDIPEKIGDYRIIGELGRGGMGVVYEAVQESLGRRVALKVLPHQSHLLSHSRLRFQQEARAAAKMHHTNIVPIFEVGEDGNHVFYAMQLILGRSLDHVIEELKYAGSGTHVEKLVQPPSNAGAAPSGSNHSASSIIREGLNDSSSSKRRHFYRSVAKIGMQVADALAYAHARGVIHRDIKPSNLLLDAEGVVWVTDFGLAKIEDEGLTQTGDFLGTLRYMSPERFRGKCDVRADIYALGLTLYELLLQRPAFEASDRLKLIQWINESTPVNPRLVDSRIPRDLETIILKSIEKEPKRRYNSAKSLEQDLGRFLSDEPIQARRISMAEQAVRWARRNKGVAASLAALAVMAIVTIGVLFYSLTTTGAALAETKTVAARSLLKQADFAFEKRKYQTAAVLASASLEFEASQEGNAKLLSARGNIPATLEWTTPALDGLTVAEMSPDGTTIATALKSGHRILLWDARSLRLVREIVGHEGSIRSLALSADGGTLLSGSSDQTVRLWDIHSGKLLWIRPLEASVSKK